MWAKSVTQVLIVQALLILQISYCYITQGQGKPTSEEFSNLNTTTEIEKELQGDVNSSSFQASVSILLTVLSPNDTSTTTTLVIASLNTTLEPDYDDCNATSPSLSETVEDDLDSLSINGSSNATHSSLLPLLITDEMDMADSLDDSVTATLMLQEDHSSNFGSSSTASSSSSSDDDDDGDSIIIASMSSNLSPDTAQPLSANVATVATESETGDDEDEESSRSDYSSSSESTSIPYFEILL